MKKLSLLFIAIALAAATVFGTVFTACGEDETKYTYSVTVYNEDMVTAVPDVTVKWSQSGEERASAVTDANGKATTELAAATYDVTLANLPEGMDCSAATATSSTREINLVIKKAEVDYTVTVTKNDNTPASGVTVTWNSGSAIAGTATTGTDGKAVKKLTYGNYTVTLSNLPEGNVFVGSKQVTGAAPDAQFALTSGQNIDFTVNVKSEGGLKFKDYTVTAYSGNDAVATAKTDNNGAVTFSLSSAHTYTVQVQGIPEGYSCEPVTLSAQNTSADLVLVSKVIETAPADNTRYLVGDIIHDYSFTTPYEVDGKKLTYKISEILKDKKAIILNFWGTNCSACVLEMPAMEQAYAQYKDEVEFLGISNYMGGDSEAVINSYRETNNYTYPMFRDVNNFTSKFALTAWPTNVVIDRYGAIARIEEGALTSLSFWEKLIDQYIGNDYTQTFTPGTDRNDSTIVENAKPDVKAPEGHYENVGETINGSIPSDCSVSWFGEPEESAEFTWPFLLKDLDGTSVLYPSNTDHDNTFSFIYANVKMTKGKVFAFDYWSQTEINNDKFYVLWDGKVIYEISGENDDWKTCYVYVDIVDGEHQLALSYIKDESRGAGFDNVYIKNARFVDIDALNDGSVTLLRPAAYGTPEENATSYPYYASVNIGDDGYYHVDLSSLENSQFAGKDKSPLLFVNLQAATQWSSLSVYDFASALDEETGEFAYDFNFTYKGEDGDWRDLIGEYVSLANISDLQGYIPITEPLKELLVAFTAHISGNNAHANEWLELCYFFSNYGSAGTVGNPIIGLTESTAIEITEGTVYSANLTRNRQPFPIGIYSFTPETSGVYEVQSLIPDDKALMLAAQVWIYDDQTSINEPIYYNGDDRLYRDGENEQNFYVKIYLEKDRKYYISVAFLMQERGYCDFKVTYTGKQSATVLQACTSGEYTLDENENFVLKYAVDYAKDNDGYYRVKYSDGTLGDYIYLDFKYSTYGNINAPLSKIINQYVTDPTDSDIKYFKVFDFRKSIAYEIIGYDENDLAVYSYSLVNTSTIDPDHADDYINYTSVMQDYCDKALEGTGKEDGLIKVNDELVKILTLYHLLRTDSIIDGELPRVLENEWLRFCWYYKEVNADHPV